MEVIKNNVEHFGDHAAIAADSDKSATVVVAKLILVNLALIGVLYVVYLMF